MSDETALPEAPARILITCPKGLPPYLKNEVLSLGLPVTGESVSSIETNGSMDDAMLLNLHLRTAHRVLFHLQDFKARNTQEFYVMVNRIHWEQWISSRGYLSVHSSVDTPHINDSRFANQKCKDAIVDRIRDVRGQRPDSGPAMDGAVIFLYWKGDQCSLYLDTSGEALAKRGYRKIPLKAPMQETLAAAVVMATGWDGSGFFINPMCGSGTLAIEAALIGLHRAPGTLRSNFGFMHIKSFNKQTWEALRAKARAAARKTIPGKIIATDINRQAVEGARKNAATAGVDHLIDFEVCDFKDTPVPEGGGIVIMNPEYGERLGRTGELEITYNDIGNFFKQKCSGYRGYVFTGNLELAKKIGLRSKSRITFYNGAIECRLLRYELYEGSRK